MNQLSASCKLPVTNLNNPTYVQPIVDTPPQEPATAERASPAGARSPRTSTWKNRLAWVGAFLLVWLIITLWRSPVITEPPYWDSAMGLFVEANFLAETNFSYGRLIYEEKRFLDGGPAVYVISIMPTLLAVVMKLAPSTQAVFVIGHLFTFACAAAVAVISFALLHHQTGRVGAGLIAAAIVTAPVFAVQVDMIGMDLPVAALGLVVVGYLSKRHYLAAGVAATFAFLIKLSGAVLTAATACFFLLLLILARWKGPSNLQRRMWLGAGGALLLIGLQLLSANWRSSLPTAASDDWDVANAQGWKSLSTVLVGCPEVVVVAILTAILSVGAATVWLMAQYRETKTEPGTKFGLKTIHDGIARNPLPVFAWIVVTGTLMGVWLSYTIPRYLILPIPLLYTTCGLLLFSQPRLRPVATVLVAVLVVFNVANSSGRFLPPIAVEGTDTEHDRRTGAMLERSREYLDDHYDNLKVIELIEEKYADRTILAGNPFSYFLSIPRLGYIDEPLHGYAVNTFSSESFPPLEEILEDPPSSVLVIRPKNRFLALGSSVLPPPDEKLDEVLLELGDDKSLVVYLHRWPHGLSKDELRWEYIQWLWPDQAHLELARKHMASGNLAAAESELLEALSISPEYADAHHDLGLVFERQEKLRHAEHEFQEAVRIDDQRADSYYRLAQVQWKLGKQQEAIANFVAAVETESGSIPSQLQLAFIVRHQERWAEAAARYQAVLDASPPQQQAVAASAGLALVLATATDDAVKNPAEAVRLAEWACQATNFENRECLEALAEAYHAAGRTQDEQRIRARLR